MADTSLSFKALGDGLYQAGNGDIICTYPLLGTTLEATSVTFDYAPFTVKVSWTESAEGVRKNPTWVREYKN